MLRYEMRRTGDRWSIIDTTTAQAAVINGRQQVGPTQDEADELAQLLPNGGPAAETDRMRDGHNGRWWRIT